MKFSLTIILVLFASMALAQPVEEWVARYNGPGNGSDGAEALALDPSGNVYVTGESVGSGTDRDYATLKYDSLGNQLWVSHYNSPENREDEARALAVDASGNVYVTGNSYNPGSHNDYTTIKYDPNGDSVWAARYNGTRNHDDMGEALAVDAVGFVYATGFSSDANSHADYTTIKYDPTNGDSLWVALYNGPGNHWDVAYALALDASGNNVYVTGYSTGSGTDRDYATIRYDYGNELWVARYNGPGNGGDEAYALALDASGNVYVTGLTTGSVTGLDYATIKYDSNGNELWVRRYNGPGNGDDRACALAVDSFGNVYVTGGSWGAGTDYDYATIKYDSEGNELWVTRYNGAGNGDDAASDLALDPSGNVYVTGYTWVGPDPSDYDYLTIEYDPNGIELWRITYNGPGDDDDKASSLALDASRNVYVTGWSMGDTTGYDYATIKYSQEEVPVEMSCEPAAPWFCRGRDFSFRLAVANNTGDDISGTLIFAGYSGHDCDPGNVLINIPRSGTYPPGVTRQYYFLKLPHALVPGKYSISVGGTLSDYEVFCCANTRIVQCSPWKEGTNIEWELVQVSRPEFVPIVTCLARNYPNPFNATTEISYTLADGGDVKLAIYNLGGRLIETLVNSYREAGECEVIWDASRQASGVYFYKLTAGDFTEVRRMTLLK